MTNAMVHNQYTYSTTYFLAGMNIGVLKRGYYIMRVGQGMLEEGIKVGCKYILAYESVSPAYIHIY